ncbi:hypothetical protein [Methyloligella solikamskensis]|uniref:Uncharacterized protein n=1 Tax=Methyloligella solikamskensis TaxID=1177756 RepID=A0ABW3J7J5_9HYPH
MIKLTKFRVIEISAAVVLTLAALLILGWQAWANSDARAVSLADGKSRSGPVHTQPLP